MKRYSVPFLVALVLLLCACGRAPQNIPVKVVNEALTVIDKGFSNYISAYTSGIIPSNSTIEVVFTKEFAAGLDKSKTTNIFSFSPSLKGKAEWADDLTLVFKPSEPLEAGTSYQGTLNLGKIGTVEERFRFFPLNIRTIAKNFSVTINPLTCDLPSGETYTVSGVVSTSDFTEATEVENYVQAKQGRRNEKIRWEHDNGNLHSFYIEKIEREKQPEELKITWNGDLIMVRSQKVKLLFRYLLQEYLVLLM